MDVVEEKRRQLKQLFPEAFTEGNLQFDQLKHALGEWIDPGKERFGLNWPGKAECMKIIQQPSIGALKPARDESVNFDETENVFIEGDNLEVLKLLQKSYFGKVKMIYIDPPYNTGKEFIYPDKYSETLNTYLEYTGQKDSEGRKFSTNTDTQGRYHSNWLNMMYPRLYLARNLLREDGVIFVSIDDNEAQHLWMVMNEVFGEENFLANIAWQGMDTIKNDATHFSGNCENILVYSRELTRVVITGIKKTEKQRKTYKNRDDDPRGDYLLTPLHAKSGNEASVYDFTFPNGQVWRAPPGRYPTYSVQKLQELVEEERIYLDPAGKKVPQKKTYWSETGDRMRPPTFWQHEQFGSTRQANKELREILGRGKFDNPKPLTLISQIVDLVADKDSTVLDFFSGSCPTAHAVFNLNKEDGGNRKFICVQLPEPTDEKSEAYKAGYKTIADIGKERIRRAGKKIAKEQNSRTKLDLGFKVFKLSRSNFKVWEGDVERIDDIEQQLLDHAAHINDSSTPEDILYELLLKSGFPLTTKIGKLKLAGKQIFSIENGTLLICLEKKLTQKVIDAIAEVSPQQVICLDEGFNGDDQLKVNAVQTFKSLAQQKEHEIVFRTV